MRTARLALLSLIVTMFVGVQSAPADSWSLDQLNPFSKREDQSTTSGRRYVRDSELGQSPLEKLNAGTQEFFAETAAGTHRLLAGTAAGTKKLFTGVKDTLSGKKPAAKKKSNPIVPWIREPQDPRHLRTPRDKKPSWLDRLLGYEEPKRVETMKDFVGLPRPEF